MKVVYVWIVLSLLATQMEVISSAKLVVIRDDDSGSKSEEEEGSDEGSSSSDESKEIDMILELLQKESSRNSRPPPVRTVKVIRRKPLASEIVTQQSVRKEKVQKPKLAKEYHVHYHNHNHQNPPAERPPSLNLEEATLKPVLWDSSHLNPFQEFYSLPKFEQKSLMSDLDRFKKFKDFETLLDSKDPFEDGKHSMRDHSVEYPYQKPSFEMLKKYHKILNSRSTPPRYSKPSTLENDDFPNRDRFAGFTDFSTLENSQQHKSKTVETEQPKSAHHPQDDGGIKDFAIVIKTKPRVPPVQSAGHKHRNIYSKTRGSMTRQEGRSVPKRPFRVPRVLDAPGGAPTYVENMHKYANNNDNGHRYNNVQHSLNSIESQQRQMLHTRPYARPNVSNHDYKGWVIQRLLR